MACHWTRDKPLSEQMMTYCHLIPKEHFSIEVYSFEIQKVIIKNAFEIIVCEISAI